MSGFLTFLIIIGLLVVVLEYSNRRRDLFVRSGRDDTDDRDRARVIADLEAHHD